MKKLLRFLLICLFMTTNASIVNAQCTENMPNPEMWGQHYYKIPKSPAKLKTAENRCKGSNTAVYFGKMKPWISGGTFKATLYEDDPAAYEPDEKIKEYEIITGSDGYINTIRITNYELGNIDSAGDQQCELYLELYGHAGYYEIIPMNLFTMQICMK